MSHYNLVHKFIPIRKFQLRKPQWTKNGRSSRRSLRGRWIRWKTRMMSFWKHEEREKESPFCYIDGHLACQKCGVGVKAPKVQRTSRASRWHCERRLWISCIHRTRFFCVSNDGHLVVQVKQPKQYLLIHSSKNGGRSKIAQDSEVRVSTRMDTSSTTQMAEILVKHGRSSGTSRTKFVWTPIGRIVMGKKNSKKFYWNVDWKKYQITTTIILVGFRGWHQNCWKKTEYGSHVQEIAETSGSWRTNIISSPRKYGMYLAWMQTERNYYRRVQEKCSNHVSTEKLPGWEKPQAKTVAWSHDMEGHAKSAIKDIVSWRTERQSNCTKPQLFAWTTTISRRRIWNGWRTVQKMPADGVKILVFGTNR